jgi:ABC-2 type transport system ATP-binding protein
VHFTLPLSGKTPNELLIELMNYGQVSNFQEVIPSMEEIFIHQVKSTQNG